MSVDLFDNAACALAVTAEDGTILQANARFSEWLGLSSAELCGRRFQDLLTMGGRIFHQTHLAPMLRLRGSVTEVKLDMLHHDGHKVTVLLNGNKREQADAVVYDLALFGTTDRDKYERELLNARNLAEALLQEKTATEIALQQAQAELSEAYAIAQRRDAVARHHAVNSGGKHGPAGDRQRAGAQRRVAGDSQRARL